MAITTQTWINKILLSNRPYYDKLYLLTIVNNMQREFGGKGRWVVPVPKSWLLVAGGNHPDKEFIDTYLERRDNFSFYVKYEALLKIDGVFAEYKTSGKKVPA